MTDMPPCILDGFDLPLILDREAARLFDVETRVINQQVARHKERFTAEFVRRLTAEETETVRSQLVTSRPDLTLRLRTPNAFTEEGVILLTTVLNSDTAIRATKQVIRTFVEVSRLSRDGQNQLPVPVETGTDLIADRSAFRQTLETTMKRLADIGLTQSEQDAAMSEALQFKEESLNAMHSWLKGKSLENAERVARTQRELAEAERARAEAAKLHAETRDRERLAMIRELLLTLELERAKADGDYAPFEQTLRDLLK